METSRSSISSSKALDLSGASWPWATTIALAVLLAIEASLHAFSARLPSPVLWGEGEGSVKIAQAGKIAASRPAAERLDVLILGPSHASIGISPAAMRDALPDPDPTIYNGAINGRMYAVIEFVYEHVYKPRLDPRTLVLTASPLIMSESNVAMERNTIEFMEAPMPYMLQTRGVERLWREFLVKDVALYRYRKRQSKLAEGFFDGQRVVDADGWHPLHGTFDEAAQQRYMKSPHPYHEVIERFRFGGPSVDAFLRIVREARAEGRGVVVVNPPFCPQLLDAVPSGRANYATYLERMSALQRELGFTWLDYQQSLPLPPTDFNDVDHLNATGAAKLSARLATDLRPLLQLSR